MLEQGIALVFDDGGYIDEAIGDQRGPDFIGRDRGTSDQVVLQQNISCVVVPVRFAKRREVDDIRV